MARWGFPKRRFAVIQGGKTEPQASKSEAVEIFVDPTDIVEAAIATENDTPTPHHEHLHIVKPSVKEGVAETAFVIEERAKPNHPGRLSLDDTETVKPPGK